MYLPKKYPLKVPLSPEEINVFFSIQVLLMYGAIFKI